MTVLVASLYLPYTIDFKPSERRHARFQSSESSTASINRASRWERRSLSLGLTPGATTDHEKIFRSYAFKSAAELPSVDDPNGPVPSEPGLVSWGRSRKFHQPPSKAEFPRQPSIVSRSELSLDTETQFRVEGSIHGPDSQEGQPSPRSLLSKDWVVKAAEQGNGALRNAISAAEEAGILTDKVWVGTLGMPTDALDDETRVNIAEILEDQFESLTVFVSDSEFEGHYSHFCRTVLWPAFHYQMQETPRHTKYDDYSWKQYVKVNEAFANTIAAHWRSGDSIWIHDYHLLLLPQLLRERLPGAEIGFFLHAAFPSSEVFRCLNLRDELLKGVLGSDLIGFQTDEYCCHFLHTCGRLLGLEVSADGVQLRDRFVPVETFSFGIDPEGLDRARHSAEVKGWIDEISARYKDKYLIVARDRLDGPAGIKQKLLAYELFLKRYPKWRENVVLIQIATSTAEIPELEVQISKIAMRINSVYSTLTHQPLVLLRLDINYSQFLALLHVAEIFMVTCLREGMNLTSHDYIQCQDGKIGPHRHGSLILSEFAGSASIFSGHELLVNPWDYRQCADAINTALEMTPEHKQRNWQYLYDRMAPHTAISWCESFSKKLSATHDSLWSHEPTQLSTLSPDVLKKSYDDSSSRLFLLEDGWMTYSTGSISGQQRAALLSRLVENPKNLVYLTSSKSPEQLEPLVRELPSGVGIIAENGCFLREIGASEWEALIDIDKTKDWREGVKRVMRYFQERTDGSEIEERCCSLVFLYNNTTDNETASRQASELADQINGARGSEAIRVALNDGAVIVEPSNVSKATAADLVLQRLLPQRPEFLLVASSGRSDEALFQWANGLGKADSPISLPHVTTLSMGTHTTRAKSTLTEDMTFASVVNVLCPDNTSTTTTSISA
ncbi:hypothetical protein MPDQ_006550 [Monascus purpureus]|uniref:Uncharacterized protein n=1 Tax=Monascus purpureus TaxID=5098 RepID=A0A507QWB0_MONPU|nr:hypothetical protein MPDQ_006550 [Monascus purpureus]